MVCWELEEPEGPEQNARLLLDARENTPTTTPATTALSAESSLSESSTPVAQLGGGDRPVCAETTRVKRESRHDLRTSRARDLGALHERACWRAILGSCLRILVYVVIYDYG